MTFNLFTNFLFFPLCSTQIYFFFKSKEVTTYLLHEARLVNDQSSFDMVVRLLSMRTSFNLVITIHIMPSDTCKRSLYILSVEL